jgi:hypothetical protein
MEDLDRQKHHWDVIEHVFSGVRASTTGNDTAGHVTVEVRDGVVRVSPSYRDGVVRVSPSHRDLESLTRREERGGGQSRK